jgi:hypothetical protein
LWLTALNLRKNIVDRLVRLTAALRAKEVIERSAGASRLRLWCLASVAAAEDAFEQIAEGVGISSSHNS